MAAPTIAPAPAARMRDATIAAGTDPVTARTARAGSRRPRRLSARTRRLALTAHILTSVGWLGIVVAMLVLGIAAASTADAGIARAGYDLMELFGRRIFPPAALGAAASGVVLSLGTKWGLVRHRWVVTKLVLTIGVIVTGTQLTGRLLEQATSASTTDVALPGGVARGLIVGSMMHLLMLAAATAISVYKPWGRTRRGRRHAPGRASRRSRPR